jgi:hypothetical protein
MTDEAFKIENTITGGITRNFISGYCCCMQEFMSHIKEESELRGIPILDAVALSKKIEKTMAKMEEIINTMSEQQKAANN